MPSPEVPTQQTKWLMLHHNFRCPLLGHCSHSKYLSVFRDAPLLASSSGQDSTKDSRASPSHNQDGSWRPRCQVALFATANIQPILTFNARRNLQDKLQSGLQGKGLCTWRVDKVWVSPRSQAAHLSQCCACFERARRLVAASSTSPHRARNPPPYWVRCRS